MLEQRFRTLSGLQALQKASSSSDYERPATKKQARAVISSAHCYGARSSSDFERSVEEAAPVRCFRVLAKQFGFLPVPIRAENLHSYEQ